MIEQLNQLEDHYRLIAERLARMRALCALPTPDVPQLCAARHGLISVSTARSKYLQQVIYPLLRASGDLSIDAGIAQLEADLSRKRAISSEHVTKWTTAAISADWTGYQAASARIARGVEARVALEKSIILPAVRFVVRGVLVPLSR